jgi:hypothetical protein
VFTPGTFIPPTHLSRSWDVCCVAPPPSNLFAPSSERKGNNNPTRSTPYIGIHHTIIIITQSIKISKKIPFSFFFRSPSCTAILPSILLYLSIICCAHPSLLYRPIHTHTLRIIIIIMLSTRKVESEFKKKEKKRGDRWIPFAVFHAHGLAVVLLL